ncbi:MAG: secretin N-terminal domain-containing protein [Prosthecobacter sp.]
MSFTPLSCAVVLWLAQGLAPGLAQQAPQNRPTNPNVQPPGIPPRIRPNLPPGVQPSQLQRPGAGLPRSPVGPQQNAQPGQQIRPAAGGTLPGAQAPGAVPGRPAPAQPAAVNAPPAALPPAPPPQAPATGAAPAPASGGNVIMYTAAPLSEVLDEYYSVTKRRVLKDRGLETATVTIEVPGEFSNEEYQSIMEKGLLMHGYAFVPSGPNLFKLVAAEQGTAPSTQGVPVILRESDLPQTDQVVSHVIQLNYLQAEEASSALQQLIPLHPYGKILAMDNARALVITEASQTIRAYIDLAREVDKPPMETMQKTFVLQRATATEVVEQLSGLLGLNGGTGGGGGGQNPARTGAVPRPLTSPQPGQPGMVAPVAGMPAAGGTSASLGGVSPEASKPILQAIERNNSIIAIARPTDMLRIESLIQELDAESTSRRYFSRRLNYLDLTVFLGIAEKALMRNSKNGAGGGLTGSEPGRTTTTPATNNTFGSNSSFGSGMNSGFGGGGLGGLGGGGMSGSSSLGGGTPLEVTKKPMSVLIANTLVIADPASSKFFASGPPEQIQALEELADELDVRPRQILISAIIGELTLSNDFNFGLDWVKTLQSLGENEVIGGALVTQGAIFNPNTLANIGTAVAAGGPLGVAGFSAYGQINRGLGVFLNTVEGNERFRVLQKPFLTTLNHQQASIYIGQQVAIAGQTFTNGNVGNNLGFTSTTQYIPVRLQLKITPHIFNENEVMLEFEQTNNGISGFTEISGNDVPNISEQGMSNSLIVANNTTAMLGGLITESDKNNKSGIPFLIRIPVIKHLFGSTSKDKDRKEMMIFVQPTILSDGPDHMLTQAKLGNHVQGFEEARAFGGIPDEAVPKALQVEDAVPVSRVPTPVYSAPAPVKEVEAKKSPFGWVKSIFSKDKKR